jgi:hypothetical protein
MPQGGQKFQMSREGARRAGGKGLRPALFLSHNSDSPHRPGMGVHVSTTAIALVSLVALGCGDATMDPHKPGVDLGSFDVDATREANTCGESALGGAPATWLFELRLRRGDGVMYWDNGAELIAGELSADGRSFSFDTGVVVDMREGKGAALPPCSVARHDRSSGTLDAEEDAFTGTLTYDFAATEGSDCADLVSSESPTFAALPCGMSYKLEATLRLPL